MQCGEVKCNTPLCDVHQEPPSSTNTSTEVFILFRTVQRFPQIQRARFFPTLRFSSTLTTFFLPHRFNDGDKLLRSTSIRTFYSAGFNPTITGIQSPFQLFDCLWFPSDIGASFILCDTANTRTKVIQTRGWWIPADTSHLFVNGKHAASVNWEHLYLPDYNEIHSCQLTQIYRRERISRHRPM